jgi:hypothetical protein
MKAVLGKGRVKLRKLIRGIILASCLLGLLFSCTYEIEGTPTYEDSGVARLYDYFQKRRLSDVRNALLGVL